MRTLSSLIRRRIGFLTVCRWDQSGRGCSTLPLEDLKQQNILYSKFGDVPLPREPYFDFIWSNVSKNFERTALVDGITGRALTYSDTYHSSKRFATALKAYGAKKGDVMALLMPNGIEYPIVFCGSSAIGVTLTTMNPLYTAKEIARQLKMSKARWVTVHPTLVPVFKKAVARLEQEGVCEKGEWNDRIIVTGGGVKEFLCFEEMLSRHESTDCQVDIDVDKDILALPYSSGTTGLPKGVMLSHFNIVANICQQVFGPDEIKIVQKATDDYQPVTLCVLPLYHIYALNVTMGPSLWAGGKLVFLPKFEPKTFIRALEEHKPNFLHLAPPLLSFCVNSTDVHDKHLESLEYVMTAAAPTGPVLYRKFKKRAPHVILREGWGMSETSPIGLIAPVHDTIEGSCGVNVPNTLIKITDLNSGEALGPHHRGEICLKGPQVMKGYLDNEKATEDTIIDGWLHSGDIAYYDEGGHIYIVDRLKELIKVKGFPVPPAELEDVLRTMPDVLDVAVIGVPHERFGEAPRAYVVLQPDSRLIETDIENFVKENCAPYKHLAGGVEFLKIIPKSASGKILRRELKDRYLLVHGN